MLHCSVSGIVDYFATDESESFGLIRDCVESLNLKTTLEKANVDSPAYDVNDLDVLGGLDKLAREG